MEERKLTSILLADDLALVRDGIARLCESSGQFTVVAQCGDGGTALQLILDRQPDVAILDLNIPRLFSLEMVRKVRELQLPVKILLLSSRSDRKLVLEALRIGVIGILLNTG